MSAQGRAQEPSQSDKHTIDLFFGALFRLGVWTGDWETWYGTRPLAPWARETRRLPHPFEDAPSQRTSR